MGVPVIRTEQETTPWRKRKTHTGALLWAEDMWTFCSRLQEAPSGFKRAKTTVTTDNVHAYDCPRSHTRFLGETSDHQQVTAKHLTYKTVTASLSPATSWHICAPSKMQMLLWNTNFLEIKFTWAAHFLFNRGAQLKLGHLFFTAIKVQVENALYKCYFDVMGEWVQLYGFCHLKKYLVTWPLSDRSASDGELRYRSQLLQHNLRWEHTSVQGISSLNGEIPSYTYLQWTDLS